MYSHVRAVKIIPLLIVSFSVCTPALRDFNLPLPVTILHMIIDLARMAGGKAVVRHRVLSREVANCLYSWIRVLH